jgi:hypothetical protein
MSGNGIDIAAVYQLLTEVAGMVADHGRKLDEHDRKLDGLATAVEEVRREVRDQAAGLAGLRRVVTEYHASVLGQGILTSELDERVRRIEQHLNLPSVG